jgi:hypothetical protein
MEAFRFISSRELSNDRLAVAGPEVRHPTRCPLPLTWYPMPGNELSANRVACPKESGPTFE